MPEPKGLTGAYRIVEMELWGRDFLDLVTQAYVTVGEDGAGRFQFGAVDGWMDWRPTQREGKPALDFSWEGFDDRDAVHGRGWAVLDGDTLRGHLWFHMGDDSSFVAERQESDY